MKYLKLYEDQKFETFKRTIEDIFKLQHIDDITDALSNLKKQYPELQVSDTLNLTDPVKKNKLRYIYLWQKAKNRWYDLYDKSQFHPKDYRTYSGITEKDFNLFSFGIIDLISNILNTGYTYYGDHSKGDYLDYEYYFGYYDSSKLHSEPELAKVSIKYSDSQKNIILIEFEPKKNEIFHILNILCSFIGSFGRYYNPFNQSTVRNYLICKINISDINYIIKNMTIKRFEIFKTANRFDL